MNIYQISDLHMGDGGVRDNFASGSRERELLSFLDFVQYNRGRLIINGDLFELWQSNMSKVLTKRLWLLDRFAAMDAIYILGNHDADLAYFPPEWLAHPFFRTMRKDHWQRVNGFDFYFCHGHQADPYNAGDTPGMGRIITIYAGLEEDRNGGPTLDKYRTVEQKVVGRLERLSSFWDRLRGRASRDVAMNRRLRDLVHADGIFCGHTHKPGRIGQWHFNSGTWAEHTNSFICINDKGKAGVFDWVNYRAVPNQTELPI